MSQHHPDGIETNIETHPVKLAIWIAVGAFAMIVGIILLASYAVGGYSRGVDSKAFTPEETAKRIAPVAKLAVDGSKAPAAPAPAAAGAKTATVVPVAIPATAAAGKPDGKAVYSAACVACHAAGVAGAPKLGDKAAWAPRIKTGIETLYTSALKGKGIMLPKGGSTAPDADIKAAVDYMVAQSK
jgi:cytochrome c5